MLRFPGPWSLSKRSRGWSFGLAVALPLLGFAFQAYLIARVPDARFAFLLEYPAVFLAAWYGGTRPGLLATAIAGVGAWIWFMTGSLAAVPASGDLVRLGVFLSMGILFSTLIPTALRQLQELNQDFVTLLNHTTDFIYFKDENSRIRFASRTLARLTGFRDWRQLIGKHDRDIFQPEIAQVYMEEERPVFAEGKPLLNKTDPYLTLEGERRWISTNKWPVFGDDGKTVVGIFGISRDITESKRAEDELQRQMLRYRTLLRAANDGFHVLDMQGNVVEVNDVFCAMLGYTQDEVRTLNVGQWDTQWSAEYIRKEMLPSMFEQPKVFETKNRRKDGRIIDVEVSAVGVEIGGERFVFASSRDITARKQAENELRRLVEELAEANRLKDIFTDVLRHDILNPMAIIKMAAGLLNKQETDATARDLVRRILQSAVNVEEMTTNAAKLAAITAGEEPEFVESDPAKIVREVLPDFESKLAEKHMILDEHLAGGFSAKVHPAVKDVVANLVSNAIKYSPPGTHIGVSTEDSGDAWVFEVYDEGPGVPDEFKEKIFNRFERISKEGVKGSGLGLTISKQIVALHGGDIRVENMPSGGSRFRAWFPKEPPVQQAH